MVNHGIPEGVLDEMFAGVRRFYGQDSEVKKVFYTRVSSFPEVKGDTMFCVMAPNPPKPEDLPAACRYLIIISSHVV